MQIKQSRNNVDKIQLNSSKLLNWNNSEVRDAVNCETELHSCKLQIIITDDTNKWLQITS